MSYVRSLVPRVTWSLWMHVGQALNGRTPSQSSLWSSLDTRPRTVAAGTDGLYTQVRASLDARGS